VVGWPARVVVGGSLLLIAGCGGDEGRWRHTQGPLDLDGSTCATALSPERTEARTVCVERGGLLTCADGLLSQIQHEEPLRLDFDASCRAALKALEATGALEAG